jgi:hypothetical protein
MVFHISSTTKISDISKQFTVLFSGCNKLKHVVLLKINALKWHNMVICLRLAPIAYLGDMRVDTLWNYANYCLVSKSFASGKEEGIFNSAPFFPKAQQKFITIYMRPITGLPVNYHSLSGRPTAPTAWHEMPT